EGGEVGGDLEEDGAGLAEIHRVKILAVDLIGGPQAQGAYGRRHGELGRIVGSAEGDVVDRSGALPGRRRARRDAQIDDGAERPLGGNEAVARVLLALPREAERLDQDL